MNATVRVAALSVLVCAGGCATAARVPLVPSAVRASCGAAEAWNGTACVARTSGAAIERGATLLANFQVDEAIEALEAAKAEGPHGYADHVRLYEQLGIAHAYLGQEQRALAAFEMLLTLAPSHLLSYTLSPKATFLFERARSESSRRGRPAVEVSWDRDLRVARPIDVEIETVSDPRAFLYSASLHMRPRGADKYTAVDVDLPGVGDYRRIPLPSVHADSDQVLEIYVTAYDEAGNEVLRWASPSRPRDIALGYEAPTPWYRKWWVWAIAGGVAATATGISVAIATDDPPAELDGDVVIR